MSTQPPQPPLQAAPRTVRRRRWVIGGIAGFGVLVAAALFLWPGGLGGRLRPPPPLPQAELFGAVPNDHRDDYPAIRRCLAIHNRCELGSGVYLTSRMIRLSSNQTLLGAGNDTTMLRLMSNSPGYAERKPGRKYSVIWTADPDTSMCRVADLTVDGNLAGQKAAGYSNSMCNVVLQGYDHLIERVKAVGFGYGSYGGVYQECFPLIIDDAYGDNPPPHHTNRILHCEVEGNALNYLKPHGGDVCGITVVALHGYGEIRGCDVHNLYPAKDTKAGNLHAYSIYGSDVVLRNSTARRIYGQAVYWDSWANQSLLVEDCVFADCRRGAWINGSSGVSFSDVIIRNVQYDNWDGSIDEIYTGFLAAEDYLVPSFVYVSGTPQLRGLTVGGNRVKTRDVWTATRTNAPNAHDRWIWFNATNSHARGWSGIRVINNVVDAYSRRSKQLYLGNGLWRGVRTFSPENVRFGNNVNLQGRPLALVVSDHAYSPRRRIDQTEAMRAELIPSFITPLLRGLQRRTNAP